MLNENELVCTNQVQLNFLLMSTIFVHRLTLWLQMVRMKNDSCLPNLEVHCQDIRNSVLYRKSRKDMLMRRFTIKKALQHLKVVMRHRRWVRHFCFKAHLFRQGLMHDLSKYTPIEFVESARYFVGTSSPIDACKKDKGYSVAWMHHKSHNKHHREYWTDNYDKGTTCIKMPWRYALECFCDFLGAGKAYNPDKFTPELEFNWWKSNRRNMKINLDTRMLLDILFIAYVNHGESILSNSELLIPLRKAYETNKNTQNRLGRIIMNFDYTTGCKFMRNFSYDYPAWHIDSAVQSQLCGWFEEE